jgi:hypothetical protein
VLVLAARVVYSLRVSICTHDGACNGGGNALRRSPGDVPESAKEIPSMPLGDAIPGTMQGTRYTNPERMLKATSVAELFGSKDVVN